MYILRIIQAYYLSGRGVNLCITTAEDPIEYCNTFLVLIIVVLSLMADDCKCCNEWEKVIKKTLKDRYLVTNGRILCSGCDNPRSAGCCPTDNPRHCSSGPAALRQRVVAAIHKVSDPCWPPTRADVRALAAELKLLENF